MSAAAAGAAAVGSVAGRSNAAVTRHGITFDTVLDAVDDLGMDPSGQDPIDDAIDDAYGEGTLIEFPPGDYLMEWSHSFNENVDRFGMVGTGSSPEDVTFTFPHGDTRASRHQDYNKNNFGWDSIYLEMFAVYSGTDHLLENFSVQQDEKTGSRITLSVADGLHIEDVHFVGYNPIYDYAAPVNLMPNVTTRDGTGVVRNFVCTGGGVEDFYDSRKVGVLTGKSHYGELLFDGFHVEEMGSHPIYASWTNGCIRVENGLFKNNDNTNIRLSGEHPDKQSWVKNCDVVIDIDNAQHLADGEVYEGARGIKCDYGDDILIENTDVEILSGPAASYGIGIQDNLGDTGSGARDSVIRDVRIRCDVDGYIPLEGQPSDGQLILDNVNVTGNGDYRYDSGVVIRNRPTDIKNSCLQLDGQTMNGIYVEHTNDCSISDTNINVDGKATVFNDASVSTTNITYSDSCPLPSTGSSGGGSSDDGSSDDGTTDYRALTLTGTGTETNYRFTVSGELQSDDLESWDDITDSTAEGWVTEDTQSDTFEFTGEVTDFEFLEGDATVTVDGTEVDPSSLGYETLRITGKGTPTNYRFTVSDTLSSDDLEKWDDITDSTAEGWVTEETQSDTFEFTGEVTDFEFLEGDATVELNGSEIDPSSYWQTLDRELTVIADAETVTDYTFSVDGDVEPVTDGDMPAGDWDDVTADGDLMVVDGVTSDTGGDRWKFSGEVVDLTLESEGAVYIDGTQVDPAKVGTDKTEAFPHHIVFDGAASTDVCEYEFVVSGAVAKSPDLGSMEAAEELTEGVVTGSVSEDTDGFRFSGSLTSLDLDGTADVTFE